MKKVIRLASKFFVALAVLALLSPQAMGAPKKAKRAKKKEPVEVREDRIKSVQRKPFLKRGRWELTPLVCLSLNDAFYQKMGGGASFAFHVADSLGIELQAMYVGTIQTDMVGYFQQANSALPRVSQMRYYVMGNFLWSPLYGKLSLFTDEIVHFDAYLVGGFGMVSTETGEKLATNIGIGLRYYVTSWMVIKLEVRDLIYNETLTLDVQRTKFSDIQNHVMLGAGVSFFLPTEFDYEYQ
jgi:outer membrane beta-barrel protein